MSLTVALIGNPNCGKTTVFNALTGSKEYVGNRAGVTVEAKKGRLKGDQEITVIDLPGIYSLSPYTKEEIITEKYLSEQPPDVILNVADASGIERSLYLTTQLAERGIPVVLMLNMWDFAEKKGTITDIVKLSRRLGIKAIKASAAKGEGLDEAVNAAVKAAREPFLPELRFFGTQTEGALRKISALLKGKIPEKRIRSEALKLLESGGSDTRGFKLSQGEVKQIKEVSKELSLVKGEDCEEIIIGERYDFIEKTVDDCVVKIKTETSATEKIDCVLTGKYTAIPCFFVIMTVVYFFSAGPLGAFLSGLLTDFITEGFGKTVEALLVSVGAADWLVSLICAGIMGGVGSVLGFLPQLALLFLMLSLLEDIGYMARAAFIMDRFFRFFGMSGKSFIPMLIATGCGVPAVMSSRTIDNPLHRRITIITSTFMPCGAKLPVISMVSTLFFGGKWWIAPICYGAGILAVLISGLVLKSVFIFENNDTPFIMELPEYRFPKLRNTLNTVWERSFSFVKKAGTVILIASGVIWFLLGFKITGKGLCLTDDPLNSILGFVGEKIAPIFTPLGFGDWRAAVATLMGLLAKEELVGVFGVVGRAEGVFRGGFEAFSFLMFNLLCAPCIAAVAAIGRELGSFKWTVFAVLYQSMLAYTAAFVVYQVGLVFSGGVRTRFTFAAFAVVGAVLVIVFRAVGKNKNKEKIKAAKPRDSFFASFL